MRVKVGMLALCDDVMTRVGHVLEYLSSSVTATPPFGVLLCFRSYGSRRSQVIVNQASCHRRAYLVDGGELLRSDDGLSDASKLLADLDWSESRSWDIVECFIDWVELQKTATKLGDPFSLRLR